MMNFADMFGKLSDMQKQMKEVKDELEQIQVESDAGGGIVKVVATGSKKVLKIKIDPTAIDKNEAELLEDLIVAGVNKALVTAEERAQQHMQDKTKGMLPNGIPGLDLSKLGFGS